MGSARACHRPCSRPAEAAQPVLATVRSQPAYEAAESERAEAVALLVPEVEGDREDAARRASAAAATMREMERAATAADPRLTALDAEVAAAEARFKAAQSRFDKPGNRFNRLGTLFGRGHRAEEAHPGVR